MTPEAADLMLANELRRRSAAWVRRYTIEQCALVAERASSMYDEVNRRPISKAEMARRAVRTAAEIRSLAKVRGQGDGG